MPKKELENSLNKSKLINLLSKLEAPTVKAFKAWFKQLGKPDRDVFLILEYILLYYPDFDSPKLQQDIAFKKIFGKLPYDYRKLMKGISQIHLDLKQYLVHSELAADDFLSDFLLAKVYTKYDLLHERQLLIERQMKPKSTPSHPEDFLNLMHWYDFSYFSEGITTKKSDRVSISKAMTTLDWYFLGQKLKYACEISTQKRLYNLVFEINFESTITKFCQINYQNLPLYHQVYFAAWQLNQAASKENFIRFKEVYTINYNQFNAEDQLYLLTHLINYSINEIRKNTKNAIESSFELYYFGIEKQIFLIDTFFLEAHFTNLISICSALEKFEWIEKVLANKLANLVKAHSPSTYNITMARLSFAKKDYLTCIGHLIEVDYTIYHHSCKARIYQIACAYELKEPMHIIESHCKSFENYLRRNMDKHPLTAQSELNSINIVRQLIKITLNKNKIQESYNKMPSIGFPVWLQQKIDLLK